MERRSNEHSNDSRTGILTDRIEMKVRRERHRRWSEEDKLRIVRESLQPGIAVQAVAERYGIGNGLLYTWRKQILATAMAGFAPVQVAEPAVTAALPGPPPIEAGGAWPRPPDDDAPAHAGRLEVEFAGGARVRVAGAVDLNLLRAVLTILDAR
jgi:transposase